MTEQNDEDRTLDPHLKDKKVFPVKSSEKLSRDEVVSNLTGRTLMVYFVLLNKKSIGVRELQRHLDLSSPSVAKYHLDKLANLHLVENKKGIYYLNRKTDLPVLTSWVLIGRTLLPKVIFAAIFFTTLFIGYLLFIYTYWNKDSMVVIMFGIIIIIYLWFDVILQFKRKPI